MQGATAFLGLFVKKDPRILNFSTKGGEKFMCTFFGFRVIITIVCAGWADPGSFGIPLRLAGTIQNLTSMQAFFLLAAIQGQGADERLPVFVAVFSALF